MPKDSTINGLGGVIKSARNSKQLTQKELSATLGISTRYLKYIENGYYKPSYALLKSIVAALDIPGEFVFKK